MAMPKPRYHTEAEWEALKNSQWYKEKVVQGWIFNF